MRVEYFTLVMQILILAFVSWTTWSIFQSTRLTRKTTALIEGYRRELGWLEARMTALEARRGRAES
jgi:hypothetical protein